MYPIALQCTSIYVLFSIYQKIQVWHMISQIAKVLLEFSGGGICFFVMHDNKGNPNPRLKILFT